jgi:hypothetical protein
VCHSNCWHFLSPEIRYFDKLLLEHNICVGQNLLRHLSGGLLCVGVNDNILIVGWHIDWGFKIENVAIRT